MKFIVRGAIGSEEANVVVQFEDCSVSLLPKSNMLVEDLEVSQYYTMKRSEGEVIWIHIAIQLYS